jgi:hypothetical protein
MSAAGKHNPAFSRMKKSERAGFIIAMIKRKKGAT